VHETTEVTRRDAQYRPQNRAQDNADQTNRQRNLAAEDDPRKHIAPLPVCTEQAYDSTRRLEQVNVSFKNPKKFIGFTSRKEFEINLFIGSDVYSSRSEERRVGIGWRALLLE